MQKALSGQPLEKVNGGGGGGGLTLFILPQIPPPPPQFPVWGWGILVHQPVWSDKQKKKN